MLEIISNLLTIRKNKFETDKDFATALGVKRQTISNWRRYLKSGGKVGTRIAQAQIERAIEVFGVSESELRKAKSQEKGTRVDQLQEIHPLIIFAPLVHQHAYAGYLSGYSDEDYMESLPKVPFIIDKEPKGNYVCFEVRGHSMDDGTSRGYEEGDQLLCRELSPDLWKNTLHHKQWDFIIVHRTDGVLFKEVIKHDTVTQEITIHSLNPEYSDDTILLSDVTQLFSVVKSSKSRKK